MTKFFQSNLRAAKVTPTQVLEIRQLYHEEGWSQGRLAREYKISVGQVGRIVRGESWQQFPNSQSDTEIENQMLAERKPDQQAVEVSTHRLLEKLIQADLPPTEAEDPLEAIIARRASKTQETHDESEETTSASAEEGSQAQAGAELPSEEDRRNDERLSDEVRDGRMEGEQGGKADGG